VAATDIAKHFHLSGWLFARYLNRVRRCSRFRYLMRGRGKRSSSPRTPPRRLSTDASKRVANGIISPTLGAHDFERLAENRDSPIERVLGYRARKLMVERRNG
jgi:hypothetical protein